MTELLAVIIIVGVLASVGIPSFIRYVQKSKSSEATVSIKSISAGAVSWYNEPHDDQNNQPLIVHFPNSLSPTSVPVGIDASSNPTLDPCSPPLNKNKYNGNATGWHSEPWKSLRFSINAAHYYKYAFVTQNSGTSAVFTAEAKGDLDCDTYKSLFRLVGSVSSDLGEVTVTKIAKTDEYE